VVEGTAHGTGQEFFQSLVRHLAEAADVHYAVVAEFAKAPPNVRTLAVPIFATRVQAFHTEMDFTRAVITELNKLGGHASSRRVDSGCSDSGSISRPCVPAVRRGGRMPQPLVPGDKRAASAWIAIHRRHCRQCALLPP